MLKLIQEAVTLPERYTVSNQAESARALMLSQSKGCELVDSTEAQGDAAFHGRQLAGAIKEVHEARVSLSTPLMEAIGKLIGLEKDYCAPLLAEKERLGRLITAYQQEERVRVEAEEKQRNDELKSLAAIESSYTESADKAKDDGEKLQAEVMAHYAQQERQELIRSPLPKLEKGKGAVTRRKLCYRVTDLLALYMARPELCVIKEKPSAILAVCDEHSKIPGIEFWSEEVTSFRAV